MRLLSILGFIAVTLLLSACGPIYQTTYSYIPPASDTGKMCATQCQQNQSMCQQLCNSRADTCQSNARSQAMYAYEEYKSEQISQGQPVTETLNDFYDDSQCSNMNCGCSDSYNSCFTTCGGQIIPKSTCVAFCNKQ